MNPKKILTINGFIGNGENKNLLLDELSKSLMSKLFSLPKSVSTVKTDNMSEPITLTIEVSLE